eukprot:2414951-Pleurochrysis_carterae.AAC.1
MRTSTSAYSYFSPHHCSPKSKRAPAPPPSSHRQSRRCTGVAPARCRNHCSSCVPSIPTDSSHTSPRLCPILAHALRPSSVEAICA